VGVAGLVGWVWCDKGVVTGCCLDAYTHHPIHKCMSPPPPHTHTCRHWTFPVKGLLHPDGGGSNVLQIVIRPAVEEATKRKQAYPYTVPTLAVRVLCLLRLLSLPLAVVWVPYICSTHPSSLPHAPAHANSTHPPPQTLKQAPGMWDVYNFLRKPASDFGWDWGPAFGAAGISGAAELVGFDRALLTGGLHVAACEAGVGVGVGVDLGVRRVWV